MLWSAAALTTVLAQAENYYVATNGNDGNAGTSVGAPLRSFSVAVAKTRPGDVVHIRGGQYYETLYITNANSGNPSQWITYKGYNGERPTIRPRASVTRDGQACAVKGASYIYIEGLAFTTDNKYNCTGLLIAPNGSTRPHHVTVNNVWSYGNGWSGIQTNQADYITIHNCQVSSSARNSDAGGSGGSGISFLDHYNMDGTTTAHNFIKYNTVYGNYENPSTSSHTDGNGIIIDTMRNTGGAFTEVIGNRCYDNGGWGIHVFLSSYVRARDNVCYNNSKDSQFGRSGVDINIDMASKSFYEAQMASFTNNKTNTGVDIRPYIKPEPNYVSNVWWNGTKIQ